MGRFRIQVRKAETFLHPLSVEELGFEPKALSDYHVVCKATQVWDAFASKLEKL